MRNIRLQIEYDGTNYCGWQIQRRRQLRSIQEVIEKSLQKILQEKIKLVSSGRTDAGVHALAQVANFRTNSGFPLDKLQKGLNALLPFDIRIAKAEEAGADFHSRFDTKSKIYCYSILNRSYSSALLRDKAYFYLYPLDLRLMKQEAKCLLGRHDFKAFCASGSKAKNTVRNIKRIAIKRSIPRFLTHCPKHEDPCLITIEIEADGFLYNMVRNIVGTLIEVGRGKFLKGSLKKILRLKNRKCAGPTVPACGLCLLEVKYK